MVVAVAGVHMVKMTSDEIVDVVTVRNGRMTAIHAVHVVGIVITTRMIGRACGGVGRIDGNRALVDVIVMDLVEVAIVQVVDMAGVANRRVPTGGAMDVIVAGMSGVRHMSSVE